jgi:DNA-binding ferritin-like protein
MPKTKRNNKTVRKHTKTNKRSITSFEKEITIKFMEMLFMVKLFHWKTHSFATHKATDELYDSLNDHMDKFIEVLLGKTGDRINLLKRKTISLKDLDSQEKLKSNIESFKKYLIDLNNHSVNTSENTDLMNIRDEILEDMNKFLYLLTFK